jgi:glutathione peroxidase-family protein
MCRYLKRELPTEYGGGGGFGPGKDLVWNFNKFLVDRHGRVVSFYYQGYDGSRIENDVRELLKAPKLLK